MSGTFSWHCSAMLSNSSSFISTNWPDLIFVTSLGGNGGKAKDNSVWGVEPPAELPTPAIALVNIMDGRSSRPLLTTSVLVSDTDRLRDMAGMYVTDVIADGGGTRPRPAGRRNRNTKGSTRHYCLCC